MLQFSCKFNQLYIYCIYIYKSASVQFRNTLDVQSRQCNFNKVAELLNELYTNAM